MIELLSQSQIDERLGYLRNSEFFNKPEMKMIIKKSEKLNLS